MYLPSRAECAYVSQLHTHTHTQTDTDPSDMTRKCIDKAQHYVLTACSATNLPGSAMCDMVCRSAAALRPTCSELGQRLSHAPRE